MLNIKAPDFILPDQNNKPFRLYDNLEKPLVLFFYPRDNSFVCTKQVCIYNDFYDLPNGANFNIAGISTDGVLSHHEFSLKYNIKYPLLSDEDKSVSRQYNALNFMGRNKRKIVLINREGIIKFINERVSILYTSLDEIKRIIEIYY
ncbi:MAG: peroxiredoxin [Melioribacteraceae bacterium]|nr:peroxiredoxin [Melioribacteraceae bacterium]